MLAGPTKLTLRTAVLALSLVLLVASFAAACPTCKDNLAHDPASANLARGLYYSILFMISMPFLIFGTLCAYFYWEVSRARKRQSAHQSSDAVQMAMEPR
jgi:heme/copper-type cytochrome/quinol oxidase subunit 2